MSYTITVAVKLGTATVTTGGEVPDGEFVISGHEGEQERTMGVSRRGVDGRFVQTAHAVHYKE